ncbi:alpha-protein kinase 2 [Pelodytes ibericus]
MAGLSGVIEPGSYCSQGNETFFEPITETEGLPLLYIEEHDVQSSEVDPAIVHIDALKEQNEFSINQDPNLTNEHSKPEPTQTNDLKSSVRNSSYKNGHLKMASDLKSMFTCHTSSMGRVYCLWHNWDSRLCLEEEFFDDCLNYLECSDVLTDYAHGFWQSALLEEDPVILLENDQYDETKVSQDCLNGCEPLHTGVSPVNEVSSDIQAIDAFTGLCVSHSGASDEAVKRELPGDHLKALQPEMVITVGQKQNDTSVVKSKERCKLDLAAAAIQNDQAGIEEENNKNNLNEDESISTKPCKINDFLQLFQTIEYDKKCLEAMADEPAEISLVHEYPREGPGSRMAITQGDEPNLFGEECLGIPTDQGEKDGLTGIDNKWGEDIATLSLQGKEENKAFIQKKATECPEPFSNLLTEQMDTQDRYPEECAASIREANQDSSERTALTESNSDQAARSAILSTAAFRSNQYFLSFWEMQELAGNDRICAGENHKVQVNHHILNGLLDDQSGDHSQEDDGGIFTSLQESERAKESLPAENNRETDILIVESSENDKEREEMNGCITEMATSKMNNFAQTPSVCLVHEMEMEKPNSCSEKMVLNIEDLKECNKDIMEGCLCDGKGKEPANSENGEQGFGILSDTVFSKNECSDIIATVSENQDEGGNGNHVGFQDGSSQALKKASSGITKMSITGKRNSVQKPKEPRGHVILNTTSGDTTEIGTNLHILNKDCHLLSNAPSKGLELRNSGTFSDSITRTCVTSASKNTGKQTCGNSTKHPKDEIPSNKKGKNLSSRNSSCTLNQQGGQLNGSKTLKSHPNDLATANHCFEQGEILSSRKLNSKSTAAPTSGPSHNDACLRDTKVYIPSSQELIIVCKVSDDSSSENGLTKKVDHAKNSRFPTASSAEGKKAVCATENKTSRKNHKSHGREAAKTSKCLEKEALDVTTAPPGDDGKNKKDNSAEVASVKDNKKVPQLVNTIRAEMFSNSSVNLKLYCHFGQIHADSTVTWTKDSKLLARIHRSSNDDSPVSLAIVQTSKKDQGLYHCSLKNMYGKVSTEFHLTSEVLEHLSRCQDTEGGEEIEFNQLLFREDFISDMYFGGNLQGRIATEDLHFGEGVHRKAFRSKVMCGLLPVFNPGHLCVLKVHNAIAYGTKSNDELVQKNYNLAVQECYVQNTAREYAKIYAAEAELLDEFGNVPEIIPIFLIHRPANNIPYATVEEELIGDFVKYSIRDGKEINFLRRESEAGQKCCTFQHWVFEKTNGNLLVTDMQGVGMKLTDVGIATLGKGYKGFKGNCSVSFIDQFKVLHQCNKYCEIMGLKSLRPSPKPKKQVPTKEKSQPNPPGSKKTKHGAKIKNKT